MTTTLFHGAGAVRAPLRGLAAGSLLAWLRDALARREARLALAQMDDRLLADIGLTREQAQREAAKPFWIR